MDYLYALQCFREAAPDFINVIFVILSEMMIYAGPLVPLVFYLCIDKNYGALVGFNLMVGDTINNVLKVTVCKYRPWVRNDKLYVAKAAKEGASGYSFPSGHTTAATAIFGSLLVRYKKNKLFAIVMVFMIILIGFTRNYLGCHDLADVLVAVVEAIIIMLLISLLFKALDKNPQLDLWILVGIIVFCIISTIYVLTKSYPMDYNELGELLVDPKPMCKDVFGSIGMLLAWGISWFVERRYINFSIEGTKKEKIIRAVIAAVIFALLYLVVLKILVKPLDVRLGSFIKRFVSVGTVAGVYPYFIKRNQLKKAK